MWMIIFGSLEVWYIFKNTYMYQYTWKHFLLKKVRTGVIIVLYKWEKDISNKYQDILYYYIARKSKQEITCMCTYLCRYARLKIICELR